MPEDTRFSERRAANAQQNLPPRISLLSLLSSLPLLPMMAADGILSLYRIGKKPAGSRVSERRAGNAQEICPTQNN
jgi:hypothetical protein